MRRELGIENIFRVRIKSGKRRNRRNQHAHRVRVVVKSIEKFLDALVNERVMRDVVRPFVQLRFRGQLAVKNQVGGLEIRAFLRELFDRISAIAQNSLVAVDVSDLAGARRRVCERRIVAHHAEIGFVHFDLAQIDRANRVVLDGNFVLAAGAIVGNGQRVPAI